MSTAAFGNVAPALPNEAALVLAECPTDARLPDLPRALDPGAAAAAMSRAKRFAGARLRVRHAVLARHKPGKRALIAYDLEIEWPDGRQEHLQALGKMRAGHQPRTAHRLVRTLWKAGFSDTSADGISVPEPLGVVPELGLWLQRRVAGIAATDLLPTNQGPALARRIADAAHKIHKAGVATSTVHTMANELRILGRVLEHVALERPEWRRRLAGLLDACRRLADRVTGTCGIHRDFYADQVVVDGDRLHLVDFDLYCQGPESLDIGNFIGHVVEQEIRQPQHRHALSEVVLALESQTLARAGGHLQPALRACAALTLARHVYLSTVVAGRAETTADVLTRAEALADVALGEGPL
jgi:hypothetical protein